MMAQKVSSMPTGSSQDCSTFGLESEENTQKQNEKAANKDLTPGTRLNKVPKATIRTEHISTQ